MLPGPIFGGFCGLVVMAVAAVLVEPAESSPSDWLAFGIWLLAVDS
jgi:hypothetical protein